MKTQSRIDTPEHGSRISGPRVVAGVAWAPSRGISRVEVQMGEGEPWVEAELSEPLSDDAWVQWRVRWEPERDGAQLLRCRATDGRGDTQTRDMSPPAPNGASGWHTVSVEVALG